MLELGAQSAEMHTGLAEPLQAAGIDLAFTCGTGMAALQERLPAPLRGAHAADSKALAALVCDAVRPGASILVKDSVGSRLAGVGAALLALGKPAAWDRGRCGNSEARP